ncbi:hypothetical protein M0804_009555 [Polistes exclamans]|nr:hypothetical protein M0804_009555 [Polistes exclamans]
MLCDLYACTGVGSRCGEEMEEEEEEEEQQERVIGGGGGGYGYGLKSTSAVGIKFIYYFCRAILYRAQLR